VAFAKFTVARLTPSSELILFSTPAAQPAQLICRTGKFFFTGDFVVVAIVASFYYNAKIAVNAREDVTVFWNRFVRFTLRRAVFFLFLLSV
jgi:hypothetical protein